MTPRKTSSRDPVNILKNLTYSKIRELEINSKFGRFTNNGTYCVLTGKFTGRSPKDKYIIDDAETRDKVWWGNINHPISNTKFNTLLKNVEKHYETLDNIYIYEGFCGADHKTRKKVRFFTENCWQHHFVKNMFIEPQKDELINFEPDFTLINACSIVDEKKGQLKKKLCNEECRGFKSQKYGHFRLFLHTFWCSNSKN